MKNSEKTMDKIVALCKNRGFIFAGSEIYGGLANTWDYGPLGVELKNNVKRAWWQKFVQENRNSREKQPQHGENRMAQAAVKGLPGPGRGPCSVFRFTLHSQPLQSFLKAVL